MAQNVMPGVLMLMAVFGAILIAFGIFFYKIGKRTRFLNRRQNNGVFMNPGHKQ